MKIGEKAPDFELVLSNGEEFRLSEQRGKVVMLQFTASWCGVCREEMPFIEKEIWQELKAKDFVLIGIDYKETAEKTKKFASDMNITYPLGIDISGQAFHKYAAPKAGVTRNIIIDKEGRIIYLTRLFEREDFNQMKAVIFQAVKE